MPMLRRLLLILAVTLLIVPGKADEFHTYQKLAPQQVNQIIPSEKRTVIDLSGPWQEVDGEEVIGNIDLPAARPSGLPVTLRRSLKMDKATLASKSWQLLFLGVSDEVSLTVNDREVMRYPGGTAPFTAQIPDQFLREGSNVIELTIYERGYLATLTTQLAPAAGAVQSGVLREIFLIGTPHVWVSDIKASTAFTNGYRTASIVSTATINGAEVDKLIGRSEGDEALRQGSVTVAAQAILVNEATGDVIARSAVSDISIERSRSIQARFDIVVTDPKMWTPESPELYKLEVRLSLNAGLVDAYSINYAFRSIGLGTVENSRRILLNGKPTFLNGIDYVEEYPETGPTMSWKQMEHDISMLKTLGVNVVRFSHRAPHPYLLHLCDKYGLMAMVEVQANGIPSSMLQEKEISALMKNRADLLATYVGSHPSIIACGLSDRLEEGRDATNSFHKTLAEIFREQTSQLLYKTILASQVEQTSEGGFDMIVVRLDGQRGGRKIESTIEAIKRVIRNTAVMITAGSLVSPGNSNGFSDPLSTESQALTIRTGYEAARNHGLAGIVVETFNDYHLEMPIMLVDHHDPYAYTSGLVDVWRQPRVSYAMYKSLINEEKEPLLQAREYDDATPLVFIATGLVLALVLTFMFNRSRRFREYFMRSVIRPYNFYADIRDQRILSTVQTLILGLVIAAGAGLVLAAILYYLRTDEAVQYLIHIIFPSAWSNEIIRYVAWRPPLAVGIVAVLVFLDLLAGAVLLRIGGMFVKGRILFRDTFTIVVWSAVPLLALLPIGIVLYQVLSADAVSFWIPLIVLAAMLWTVFRVLRATSIVFDVSSPIVYLIGLGFLAVIFGVFAAWWTFRVEGFQFLQYYQAVIAV